MIKLTLNTKAFRRFFYWLPFIAAPVFGATVNLAWDAPSDTSQVVGYRVFYGTQSGNYTQNYDAGNTLTASIAGLNEGTTYFFAVVDYAGDGRTGGYSNEVSATTQAGAPVAGFSANPSSGVAPLSVTFTSSSTGTVTSYAWNFGDGGSATTQNATHIYTSAGSFPATLTVSGPGGSNTSSASIITVTSGGSESLFTSQTPALLHSNDGVGYELGLRFTANAAGQIIAIRFWKDSLETGTHVGRLWSAAGVQLASVTFAAETTSGWQTQNLLTPYNITANVEYMVTVNTGAMYFVDTQGALTSVVTNGHLSSVVGTNGRYGPVGQYPTQSFNSSNYFRDVAFVANSNPPPSDTTPPVVSISTPTDGAVLNGKSVTINSSATDDVGIVSLILSIDGIVKKSVTAPSLSYVWNIRNVSRGQHSIAVTAADAAGNQTTKTIMVTK